MTLYRKIVKYYAKFFSIILSIIFAITFLMICVQVFSRYILHSPIVWTDEAETVMSLFMAFMGIAYGVRSKKHIALKGVVSRLPGPAQHVIDIAVNILLAWCMWIMIEDSVRICATDWTRNLGTVPLARGKVFAIVPVSFVMTLVYLFFNTVDDILVLFGKNRFFALDEADS